MTITDGFPGQRMLVLPRARVREFLDQPRNNHIVVSDCGYFPEARSHGRTRNSPVAQLIVLVCAQGRGWCQTATGRFGVEAGQVVVLPPGFAHSYGSDPAAPWTLWWLHIDGQELPAFCDRIGMTIESPVRTPTNLYPLVSLMAEIVQRMEQDATGQSLFAATGAAWHLLTLLVADQTPSGSSTEVVEHAAEYLRAHISEHISVGELSAIARLSSSHFSTVFKKHFGYSVVQYQTQLRMARARELLDTTTLQIAAVASAVGYQDAFYFTRHFHRIHGMTPRAYRSRHTG